MSDARKNHTQLANMVANMAKFRRNHQSRSWRVSFVSYKKRKEKMIGTHYILYFLVSRERPCPGSRKPLYRFAGIIPPDTRRQTQQSQQYMSRCRCGHGSSKTWLESKNWLKRRRGGSIHSYVQVFVLCLFAEFCYLTLSPAHRRVPYETSIVKLGRVKTIISLRILSTYKKKTDEPVSTALCSLAVLRCTSEQYLHSRTSLTEAMLNINTYESK